MVSEVKDIMTKDDNPHKDDFVEVGSIVMCRWEKMDLPLHFFSICLMSKILSSTIHQYPSSWRHHKASPNIDKEVMTNVLEAFSKIVDSSREQQVLREQFNAFIIKKGMFALPHVQLDAFTMDTIEWWVSYGSETPDLAEVAKKSFISTHQQFVGRENLEHI
jgi:hypothetical protein